MIGLDKKIVYTVKGSAFNTLAIIIESDGAVVVNCGDDYQFTLSVTEIKGLQEILVDVLNEIDIMNDTKKDL